MKRETAVFGGGCFWCTEVVFKMMKGIYSVIFYKNYADLLESIYE